MDYLVGVQRDHMGLTPDRDRLREVAAVRVDHRDSIRNGASGRRPEPAVDLLDCNEVARAVKASFGESGPGI